MYAIRSYYGRIDSIVSEAQRVFALQRKAYLAHPYPSFEERKQNLTKLEKMIIASVDELAAAVMQDFGHRCPEETKLLEIFTSVDGIRYNRKKLAKWMKPIRRSVSPLFFTVITSYSIHYTKLYEATSR